MGHVERYYVNKVKEPHNNSQRDEEEMDMGIKAQAERIGFQVIGELTRCMDREPTHLYQCYFDEAKNEFILRRGILTIIASDGTVF